MAYSIDGNEAKKTLHHIHHHKSLLQVQSSEERKIIQIRLCLDKYSQGTSQRSQLKIAQSPSSTYLNQLKNVHLIVHWKQIYFIGIKKKKNRNKCSFGRDVISFEILISKKFTNAVIICFIPIHFHDDNKSELNRLEMIFALWKIQIIPNVCNDSTIKTSFNGQFFLIF